MKASTQYNDFVGTAAADISDYTKLADFLVSKKIDIKRYEAIGVEFYSGYNDSFYGSVICVDKNQSTESKPHIVSLSFESGIEREAFFDLFKRFNVMVVKKHSEYATHEIDEEIVIDDRENPIEE